MALSTDAAMIQPEFIAAAQCPLNKKKEHDYHENTEDGKSAVAENFNVFSFLRRVSEHLEPFIVFNERLLCLEAFENSRRI